MKSFEEFRIELKEYSPNVSYQAKGGKKSGKLGKSSVYSLRGKDESKKDFRKSHVKDVEGGYVGGGHKPTPGSLKKEDYYRGTGEKEAEVYWSSKALDQLDELNRYEKETGTSSGSMNMPKGRPTQKGGTSSPVMRAVRTSIRRETGKPTGQTPKIKGEKGNRQPGDRKTTPADSIAKRRQSRADAEKLMRDTRGT